MEGLGLLNDEILLNIFKNGNINLIEQALKILPEITTSNAPLYSNIFYELVNKKNKRLDIQLLAILGRAAFMDEEDRYLLMGSLLMRHPNDSLACEAALSALAGKEDHFKSFLNRAFGQQMNNNQLIFSYLQQSGQWRSQQRAKPAPLFDNNDMRTAGLKLYAQYCAACHRPGGEGTPNLAPPLLGSEVVNGPKELLASVIWHGKSAPVLVNGQLESFKEPMQAFKDNPAWDEKMLEAVVAYVQNAFAQPD
jgi:mono/diheme cytochrome c family protein